MGAVHHVVLVQWKDATPPDVREAARDAARSFRGLIPGIVRLDEGPSVSPEGLEGGYEWGLLISFEDSAARDAYLPHPTHRVLADLIGAHSSRVVVFDLDAP